MYKINGNIQSDWGTEELLACHIIMVSYWKCSRKHLYEKGKYHIMENIKITIKS